MRSYDDVQDALDAVGVALESVHLPSSSRAAQLATDALRVPPRGIVKSNVFCTDGWPLPIVASGHKTVGADALAFRLGPREVVRAWAGDDEVVDRARRPATTAPLRRHARRSLGASGREAASSRRTTAVRSSKQDTSGRSGAGR